MTEDDKNNYLKAITKDGDFPTPEMCRYLTIYVGSIDWTKQLAKLWSSNKIGHDSAKMKQVVSATILLPYVDKSTYIDPEHPENLLLKMPYYQQLGERDWFAEFKKIYEQDSVTDARRRAAYALGIVTPFEYSPLTRQAYNWLYTKAEDTHAVDTTEQKKDVSERFKNLVTAYGGAVICNIFSRHEASLKKVVNWRTGYFFEKIIYEVYTPEQVLKIKKSELDSTNTKLVKSVRIL